MASDETDKVKAASDALADLFQDDDPAEEAPISNKRREDPATPEGVYEANIPTEKIISSKTPDKLLAKNSPIDLYGCDEMSPQSQQQSQQQQQHQTQSILETKKLKPQLLTGQTSNNVKFQLDNNDQDINEQVLAQIMSNSSQQSNYSNVNYLMRRERSLDRCPQTENFIENYLITQNTQTRRSYNGTSQSPSNNLYTNVASLYSTPQQHQSKRSVNQHHRSNSILNASTRDNG